MLIQPINFATKSNQVAAKKSVNFKAEDLSVYDSKSGQAAPPLEVYKEQETRRIAQLVAEGKIGEAISGKLGLIEICTRQGKMSDVAKLKEGVRELARKL